MSRRYHWHGPHTRAQEAGITADDVPTGPRWGDECGGCEQADCWACQIRLGLRDWGKGA